MPEPRVRYLRKLADHLDELPPENFAIMTWFASRYPDCGTRACALGHAALMPYFNELGLECRPGDKIPSIMRDGRYYSGFDAAEVLFNIDSRTAINIFGRDGYGKPDHFVTAADVSKKIRRLTAKARLARRRRGR